MDQFHLLRVFSAVAEQQGFAAAARQLRISAPAVTRAIGQLEDHLGAKLLERTTRHVHLTDVGSRYLEDSRAVLEQLAQADQAAAGINAAPRGLLTVTAPSLFGRRFVAPLMLEYLRRFPDVQVNELFVDRRVNLVEEGIDVGIRIGDLPDSNLRARRVGTVSRVLCASPAYLQEHGNPESLGELQQHNLIDASPSLDWRFQTPEGLRTLNFQPRLSTSDNGTAIHAACAGFGITRVLSYQVAAKFASGELIRLLPEFEPEPWPVNIIHRQGPQGSAKVRSCVDLLAENLQQAPCLKG
ncbi:LysR family transcriptional regulator [Aliamphritea spongicola]|uniref:LysR family transcriptional regulator n=1 Tax=Aliamphritea spongicola TaxID=707589 RepID=UPI00196A4332|nr:LysR family transcriptional regulator [Aliamphritea spongicola]MBN3562095.1 LysR family transcriptional regulator [Aliamphritea spongicola]